MLVQTLRYVLLSSAVATAASQPPPLIAQAPPSPDARADSARVVPGAHYRVGWLHRLLLGSGYRVAWTDTLDVEILAPDRFAGGLTPLCTGGGLQTTSLRFRGGDGRQYVFRAVDKDPGAAILPSFLRKTFADSLLRDQTSAGHPTASLAAAQLLEAVDILHADPRLVIMPDDPQLGDYRDTYAGLLGMIEERPTDGPDGSPGFAGSRRIENTEYVWAKIEESAEDRVDAPAFLAARLIDVLIGDWDRHYDQWRWARFPADAGYVWKPIPRDRDHAFARFNGIALWLARFHLPQFVNFGESYGNIYGLTWSGRALDRRLLAGLQRSVWDSVTQVIQARLSDDVIEAAVRRLPSTHDTSTVPELARTLKRRRDGLDEAARRFYALLAKQVDVHATDQADVAEITHLNGSRLEVALHTSRSDNAASTRSPYYRRTFFGEETKEVRVYLHGGRDTAVVRGNVTPGVRVQVIGGGGRDVLRDSSAEGRASMTRFYDLQDPDDADRSGIEIDRRRFQPPPRTDVVGRRRPGACSDPRLPPRDLGDPFRDWGTLWWPLPWLSYQPDVGLVFGAGFRRVAYGFRKVPFSSQTDFRAGFASGPDQFYVEYRGDSHDLLAGLDASLAARYSGVDVVRFFGFGNETALSFPDDFYRLVQRKVTVDPSLTFFPSPAMRLAVGPFLRFTQTRLGQSNLIDSLRPYGSGKFIEAGIQGSFTFDNRDRSVATSRGTYLSAGARLAPRAFDVTATFGTVFGTIATYLTADMPLEPTLAVRFGGAKVWGRPPFHELAYVGGATTLRGYGERRFLGQASAYGNAELRVLVRRFSIGEGGLIGLADVGRVFYDGESSDRWHSAIGGGVWFALANRGTTVNLTFADGERVSMYAKLGFMF